jgi:hypothetical protein
MLEPMNSDAGAPMIRIAAFGIFFFKPQRNTMFIEKLTHLVQGEGSAGELGAVSASVVPN